AGRALLEVHARGPVGAGRRGRGERESQYECTQDAAAHGPRRTCFAGRSFGAALAAAGAAGARLAALEPLDSAAGVDQLLAAGVERVAVGADLDVELGLGRARGGLVAARTAEV